MRARARDPVNAAISQCLSAEEAYLFRDSGGIEPRCIEAVFNAARRPCPTRALRCGEHRVSSDGAITDHDDEVRRHRAV